MAVLTTKTRNELPDSAFALPGRRFPIHNISHARNALARASQVLGERDRTIVQMKVHRRYPSLAGQRR